ncbi:pilin [Aquabacterium sp.]|uniref:pilin n=1 Tax=Aquabacterium sp. TaxID=1872578 RepID=UPI0035B1175E
MPASSSSLVTARHPPRRAGFTLIEIMVTLAVLAILTTLVLPSYTDYRVRSRVSEGLLLALEAKATVADGVDAAALAARAQAHNLRNGGNGLSSKYVRSILIDAQTGTVTITFTPEAGVTPGADTLTLTPYVIAAGAAPIQVQSVAATGSSEPLLWGCASTTSIAAAGHGVPPVVSGTLPAKWAPTECR